MSTNEFDAYALNYRKCIDHKLRKLVDPTEKYFIEVKFNIIKKMIHQISSGPDRRSNKKILIADIGCGIGDFEYFFMQEKLRVNAIDLSFKMVEIAYEQNKNLIMQFSNANAKALPFDDQCCDLVFSSCMFHHLPEQEIKTVINEMVRICKAPGFIIFFEHNPCNLLTQIVVRTTPIDEKANLISRKELRKKILDLGLKIYQTEYFLYGPKMIDGWLSKSFPIIKSIPAGGQYYIVISK